MPVVQGKIYLKGPIEFEGYLHDENTEVEKEQSCTREVRGTVGSRENTHTHTAMREELEQLRERLRTSTPRTQQRERENSPQGGAKDGKRERADDCREEEKSGSAGWNGGKMQQNKRGSQTSCPHDKRRV